MIELVMVALKLKTPAKTRHKQSDFSAVTAEQEARS